MSSVKSAVQEPYRSAVLALSSAFGLGYLPKAPGTFGTLAALPVWWLLRDVSWPVFALVALGVFAFATWVSSWAERIYGGHDTQHIVIDEVAGMLVTVVGIPFTPINLVLAFIVFRLLDMTKPWPIRWFDDNVQGGFGVVVDDVVAGLFGCGILHLVLQWL